jgi:hypothetical protein
VVPEGKLDSSRAARNEQQLTEVRQCTPDALRARRENNLLGGDTGLDWPYDREAL